MAKYYKCQDNDELDVICKAYYGYSRGSVEAVVAHELNRELAEKLPVLSLGDVLYLPTLAPSVPTVSRANLWD